MDRYRLKLKIGEHEFEAEGPTDVVQAQFEAFKDLIANSPIASAVERTLANAQSKSENGANADIPALPLDKITRTEDRIVSLTARPATIEDAALLVLLGQRVSRGNDAVTGGEIIGGLRQSGFSLNRVDWRLEKLATEGMIIKIGTGRASRYRLTNQGMSKAQGIAKDLIALVP